MDSNKGGGRRRGPPRRRPPRDDDPLPEREALEQGLASVLRGPLTGLVTEADRLSRDPALPPEARAAAARLVRQGERAVAIVRTLLDIARLEAGRLPIVPEPVPVAWVLAWAAGAQAPDSQDRGAALDVEPAAEGMAVVADRALVNRMVEALLRDAIEAAPPGGRVSLRARRAAGGVRVRIEVEAAAASAFATSLPFCRLAADPQGGAAGVDDAPQGRAVAWVSLPAG